MLTSKDILYLIIAFCVVWVTIFLCWMFYYVTRILKNASQIIEEFRTRLQTLTETMRHLRDKVDIVHDILSVAGLGVAQTVQNMVAKKAKNFVDKNTHKLDKAAKEAVDAAVEATAEKFKKWKKNI